jgi:hypothetical protein
MSNDTGNAVENLDFLIRLLGPERTAALTRPLTAEEEQLVEEALARHGGDPVAALGMPNLPADVQSEIRRVMA